MCPSTTSAWTGPATRLEVAGPTDYALHVAATSPPPTVFAHHRRGGRRHRHPRRPPLMAAAADKACEVIGAGGLESHIGCLSYGTTATINTTRNRYLEVTPFIPPYPSAIPDAYGAKSKSSAAIGWSTGSRNNSAIRKNRSRSARRTDREPVRRTGQSRAPGSMG